jgi:hypothetical protein
VTVGHASTSLPTKANVQHNAIVRKNWYVAFLVVAFLIALFPPNIIPEWKEKAVVLRFVSVFDHSIPPVYRDWQTAFALELPCLFAFAVFGLRRPAKDQM